MRDRRVLCGRTPDRPQLHEHCYDRVVCRTEQPVLNWSCPEGSLPLYQSCSTALRPTGRPCWNDVFKMCRV